MMAWALVGTTYAQRSSRPWHCRIPVAFYEEIITGSTEGRIYQATSFSLIFILPLSALVHFWDVVRSAPVLTTGVTPRAVGMWELGTLTSWDDPARLCSAINASGTHCVDGCTMLPVLEPGLFALLSGGAMILSAIIYLSEQVQCANQDQTGRRTLN